MPEEAVTTFVGGERQGVSKTFAAKSTTALKRKAPVEKHYSTEFEKEEKKEEEKGKRKKKKLYRECWLLLHERRVGVVRAVEKTERLARPFSCLHAPSTPLSRPSSRYPHP